MRRRSPQRSVNKGNKTFSIKGRHSKLNQDNHQSSQYCVKAKRFLFSTIFVLLVTCMILRKYRTMEMLLLRNGKGSDPQILRKVPLQQTQVSLTFSDIIISTPNGFYLPDNGYKRCENCTQHSKGLFEDPNQATPDYNSLEISFHNKSMRSIALNDSDIFKDERTEILDDYGFDLQIAEEYRNDEDLDGSQQCFRNNWHSKPHPVCNLFHETAIGRTFEISHEYDMRYLGHGYYRHAWCFQRNDTQVSDSFVLKSLRNKHRLKFDQESMLQVQKEAIVMERLTASPRIVDIYALCGTSVFVEAMESTATSRIIPNQKHMDKKTLDRIQDKANGLVPMNNMTLLQKLDWATAMAESIADLHGYKGGAISHGDVHPDQWLVSSTGALKLNDFNFAEILDYNPGTSEYCRTYRTCFHRKFASPEELRCEHGNEAMDTYSIGHSIYGLVTGLPPHYEYPNLQYDVKKAIMSRRKRLRPYVDIRYRNRSMVEGMFVKIMERCWEQDFEKRISVFEVVQMLRQVKGSVQRN